MQGKYKYYLVDEKVLPEVFLKVVYAKQLLAQGKAQNLSTATKMADISRSAFYKYKDCVFPYLEASSSQIANIHASLLDEPGVLSSLIGELYKSGANILTINQNIPIDGVAPVSISMRVDKLEGHPELLLEHLRTLYGVVDIKLLAN